MPAHIIQRKEKRYEKQTNIRGSPLTMIGLTIPRISLSRKRLVAKAYMEVSDRVRNGCVNNEDAEHSRHHSQYGLGS